MIKFFLQALLKISPDENDPKIPEADLMPICLPDDTQKQSFKKAHCTATGHNSDDTGGAPLHEAITPVLEQSICSKSYDVPEFGHVKIRDSHVCAGSLDGSTGTCVVSQASSQIAIEH